MSTPQKYNPMMPIQMGSVVRSVSVSRANVAGGTKGRAVLIDPNPRAVYLAYDQANRCAVLVDQEAAIKYKLQPRTYYIFLIARLNTDMKGDQVGDDITVEYLRLSDNVYEEFVDHFSEMPNVETIVLKLVQKAGNNGKDFSYVQPVPSSTPTSEAVLNKLQSVDVESLWSLVRISLGKTVEEYEEILANAPISEEEERRFSNAAQGRANISTQRQLPRYRDDSQVSRQRTQEQAPVRRNQRTEPVRKQEFAPAQNEQDDLPFEDTDDFQDMDANFDE